MNLDQFNLLQTERQLRTAWTQGVHLANRNTLFFSVALYQIDNFYVEVFYSRTEKKVVNCRSFTATDLLAPYLEQMCIEDIFDL